MPMGWSLGRAKRVLPSAVADGTAIVARPGAGTVVCGAAAGEAGLLSTARGSTSLIRLPSMAFSDAGRPGRSPAAATAGAGVAVACSRVATITVDTANEMRRANRSRVGGIRLDFMG